MHKYSLNDYFDTWTKNKYFLRILVGRELFNLALRSMKIIHGESASRYRNSKKTFQCMTNHEFWEIVDRTPDLAFKKNLQIRLMGNFGLQ